jgi:hypothetical protein
MIALGRDLPREFRAKPARCARYQRPFAFRFQDSVLSGK